MRAKPKLKAFTIMELLVSMTLTGILVAFGFMGYNQVQKLFVNYTLQNRFVNDYNQLGKALGVLSERCRTIEMTDGNKITFNNDSSTVVLDPSREKILLKFASHTDTFGLEAKDIHVKHVFAEGQGATTLIRHFDCEVMYQSQKFRVSFDKQYDASTLLKNTLEFLPTDEQP